MILLIDNYDSFTYNVYQAIANLGRALRVVRNDCVTLDEIAAGDYEALIISPGPGTPDDAGISKEAVRQFAGKLPILGICLGHQVIGEAFGAKVIRKSLRQYASTKTKKKNCRHVFPVQEERPVPLLLLLLVFLQEREREKEGTYIHSYVRTDNQQLQKYILLTNFL